MKLDLPNIIGKTVVRFERNGDTEYVITFSDGSTLEFSASCYGGDVRLDCSFEKATG